MLPNEKFYSHVSFKKTTPETPSEKETKFLQRVSVQIFNTEDDTDAFLWQFIAALVRNSECHSVLRKLITRLFTITDKDNWRLAFILGYKCLVLTIDNYFCSEFSDKIILAKAILNNMAPNSEFIEEILTYSNELVEILPNDIRTTLGQSHLIYAPFIPWSNAIASEIIGTMNLKLSEEDTNRMNVSASTLLKQLPSDTHIWSYYLRDCYKELVEQNKMTNSNNDFNIDRDWLGNKAMKMGWGKSETLDDDCDRMIILCHLPYSNNELSKFLLSAVGIQFAEDISEIIEHREILKTLVSDPRHVELMTSLVMSLGSKDATGVDYNLSQMADQPQSSSGAATGSLFENFSMLYVKPEDKQKMDKEKELTDAQNLLRLFENLCESLPKPHGGLIEDLNDTSVAVQKLIMSPYLDNEMVDMFIEVFGCDYIEVAFELVRERERLKNVFLAINNNTTTTTTTTATTSSSNSCSGGAKSKILHKKSTEKSGPSIASQVVVQSAIEKRLKKELRKGEKRRSRYESDCSYFNDGNDNLPMPSSFDEIQRKYQEASMKPIFNLETSDIVPEVPVLPSEQFGDTNEVCPHVYESSKKQKFGMLLLAEGTKINSTSEYKIVDIPAMNQSSLGDLMTKKNLIKIESLDPLTQKIFSNIKTLNTIQSIVFPVAFNTNENLLICAPTGAGKTNTALLTVAHCLQNYCVDLKLQDDNFKIIYVAPMKALASEMTKKFSTQLSPIGVKVRELTGDMQLSASEIRETQILVTTPEKWDVVTRKPDDDTALPRLVRLLIIDEVHLLNEERGHVIEALVARTLRLVEKTQMYCRIVGLSATLPNYKDVAKFLRVNITSGLFYFDQRFRPVPLQTTFIGCKHVNVDSGSILDTVCYEQVINALRKGHQVMVFVHTRRGTVATAKQLRIRASQLGTLELFQPDRTSRSYINTKQRIERSRHKELSELFQYGISVHHAGMFRADRNYVENAFTEGHIRVLICTATLAWGVNLPAHTVIIKGTNVYCDGRFKDLDILDVQQIFGRAGRPQFDTSGHAILITELNKLDKYLRLMTNQVPIESNFIKHLSDNLNAEIVLGTVTNVQEAVTWLNYTYLVIRMVKNPLVYGITYQDQVNDPDLYNRLETMIRDCALRLDLARMIRYNKSSGDLVPTDYGRIASHYYIKYDTIMVFNDQLKEVMTEGDVFNLLSTAQEFEQLHLREEEIDELLGLQQSCPLPCKELDNVPAKINILMQAYVSRIHLETSSLVSDLNFVIQNIPRLSRAIFEIYLRLNNALMSGRMLKITLMFDRRQWDFESPLRQFNLLLPDVVNKLESRQLKISQLKDMEFNEILDIVRSRDGAHTVKRLANTFPFVSIDAQTMPITRQVLRIELKISADFSWDSAVLGGSQPFWVWIEDPNHNIIYHYEYFLLSRKSVIKNEPVKLFITIPLVEPTPAQYYVRVSSDQLLQAESYETISFINIVLPKNLTRTTKLESLIPLSTDSLHSKAYQKLYKFDFFNPIQTQMFFVLYHSDINILLGAPTGSGKTIVAEIAILRLFNTQPHRKVVYVAPLKALVRERVADWKHKFTDLLHRKVIEMTGDSMPEKRALDEAQVIITTPEKWDVVSRNWESRSYVKSVGLLIMDEIHLLGEDRGPVLEAIVSRTNYISSKCHGSIRMIGLSTGIANAYDLAYWLGVPEEGLYNFSPSVRPVPLEVHISGYQGKHYCPRMALMNKPTFQAIQEHASDSPTLVFVSSRRQTRITAIELITFLSNQIDSRQWIHMPENEIMQIIECQIKDETLQHTLLYGVGVHHAGLIESDRAIVEQLFLNQKIQVLVATATLAWGVNLPAHLVVIKGTEYYDGKFKRYIDMPITDVLQMMGRAGRPQFDQSGVAVVLVQDIKKNFYKKFLYEPFPVESHMLEVLHNHLYAEIATGTISTVSEAVEFLFWTYLFRRLCNNPSYYGLKSSDQNDVSTFITDLVDSTVSMLQEHNCCILEKESDILTTTPGARIGANYYLDMRTVFHMTTKLGEDIDIYNLLKEVCFSHEFSEVPVRHNEELMNAVLARDCRYPVETDFDSPHIKTYLLIQSHLSQLPLPCVDYLIDLKLILEQMGRVLQAFLEYAVISGWLKICLRLCKIGQMLVQARWLDESFFLQINENITDKQVAVLENLLKSNELGVDDNPSKATFAEFVIETKQRPEFIKEKLCNSTEFTEQEIDKCINYLSCLPILDLELILEDSYSNVLWKGHPDSIPCIEVALGQFYTLILKIKSIGKSHDRVIAPLYPRVKQEGWMILFGSKVMPSVFIKRFMMGHKNYMTQNIRFETPDIRGTFLYKLLIVSDSYMGLDQEYEISLHVALSETSTEV